MNDAKIISALREHDEQMLAYVVQKYSKLLWKIAVSVLANTASTQDVEECIADAFIYLWQHPEGYDPNKAKLSSWLAMITRSKAIDRYRQIAKNREVAWSEAMVDNLGCTAIASEDDVQERLLACLAALADSERELLIRRYYYEQKPAEIALALDLPKKQIENRLYYARQKLKKMMERGGELYGEI